MAVPENGPPPKSTAQPVSLHAGALLLEVVRESHLNILPHWLPHAHEIISAASAVLNVSGEDSAGLGKLKIMAREIRGRAKAASLVQEKGITGLLDSLASVLPVLQPSG